MAEWKESSVSRVNGVQIWNLRLYEHKIWYIVEGGFMSPDFRCTFNLDHNGKLPNIPVGAIPVYVGYRRGGYSCVPSKFKPAQNARPDARAYTFATLAEAMEAVEQELIEIGNLGLAARKERMSQSWGGKP